MPRNHLTKTRTTSSVSWDPGVLARAKQFKACNRFYYPSVSAIVNTAVDEFLHRKTKLKP